MRGSNEMAEAPGANSMESISTSSASTRERGIHLLNEVAKVFVQFFMLLLAIIGIAATNTRKGKYYYPIVTALALALVIYHLALVLGTVLMLQFHITSFIPIMVIFSLACIVSVLALSMISSTAAWIGLAMWLMIFALMSYYYRQVLYQMIPERIKILIESRDGIMPTHNSELSGTETGPETGPEISDPQLLLPPV